MSHNNDFTNEPWFDTLFDENFEPLWLFDDSLQQQDTDGVGLFSDDDEQVNSCDSGPGEQGSSSQDASQSNTQTDQFPPQAMAVSNDTQYNSDVNCSSSQDCFQSNTPMNQEALQYYWLSLQLATLEYAQPTPDRKAKKNKKAKKVVPSSDSKMDQDSNSCTGRNFVNTGDEQFNASHQDQGGSCFSFPQSKASVSNKESKFDTSTFVRKTKKNKKAKKVVPPSPSKSSDDEGSKISGSATYIEVPIGILTSGGASSLGIEIFQADRARYGQQETDMSTLEPFAKRIVSLSDLANKKQKEGYHYLSLKKELNKKALGISKDTTHSYYVKIGDYEELFFLYCETSKADNVQNIITLDDQGRFLNTRHDNLNKFSHCMFTPDVSNA